jgi:hypothetical protein
MVAFPLAVLLQAWEDLAFIDQKIAGEIDLQARLPTHEFSLPDQTWDNLATALNRLHFSCGFLGINTGIAKIQWIHQRRLGGGWPNGHVLKSDLVELRQLICTHVNRGLVFVIPNDKVPFYNGNGLFDHAVLAACEDAAIDIAEAGKCFALGLWTATVFHLMRIMELGVLRFANKLAITLDPRATWGAILNAIDPAINRMPIATPAEAVQKTAYQRIT